MGAHIHIFLFWKINFILNQLLLFYWISYWLAENWLMCMLIIFNCFTNHVYYFCLEILELRHCGETAEDGRCHAGPCWWQSWQSVGAPKNAKSNTFKAWRRTCRIIFFVLILFSSMILYIYILLFIYITIFIAILIAEQ